MLTATWDWLWEKHAQAKETVRFFVRPQAPEQKTKQQDTAKEDDRATKKNWNSHQLGGGGGGDKRSYTKPQLFGLIAGPLFFLLTLGFFSPEDLSSAGVAVLASTIWIAIWWITEAAPIPATSLLPLILFPLTSGLEMDETASAYGSSTIFLFMGGFMVALAMEKWNLHRRIALHIISVIGTNMERMVLGFMIATGFLSMWISNTATAMMMVPIGLAIIYQVADALKDHDIDTSKENFGFGKAIMLGIAFSASVGGVATIIGTPPNAALANVITEIYGMEVSFAKWMLFGVPIAWVFIFIIWFYLVKVVFPQEINDLPGGKAIIEDEKEKIGKPSYEENMVLVVFVLTALVWITRSFFLELFIPNISDAVIAMTAAIILFLIPSRNKPGDHLLDWDTAVKLPWGILLLFGGGLAIAQGFTQSGLSEWIGQQLTALDGIHIVLMIAIVGTLVVFLTELTSNTATANMMYPIMASLALSLGVHPYAFMVAAAVTASCAFMLPVATPPNAVVFGSGYLRIPDMAKAGFALNLMSILITTLAVAYLLPLLWGIDLTTVPDSFQ